VPGIEILAGELGRLPCKPEKSRRIYWCAKHESG
jgi:hypothetical protein